MIKLFSHNEQQAEAAFTLQAPNFDELYNADTIIQYKRKRVRDHLMQYLQPGSSILELNAGTGEDAIFFARQGHHIHATDISAGMQQVLKEKAGACNLQTNISNELCSFTQLDQLQNKGPFDAIFSNFAGLNCTSDLDKVLASFDTLLKPGGTVTLVILPKFCLWETLLVFKGKFKTATRRFFSNYGRKANINGKHFRCWYYDPSFIISQLKSAFGLLSIEGLCTVVPPSYINKFAENRPKLFTFLKRKENVLKTKWPWKYIGDYYIISLEKKQ
ncbi:MAG: Methyltransferase protein [Chitinophagaceae bacterium]|nr:Methyltransferase protein [Chitinophagaceae bacterium]